MSDQDLERKFAALADGVLETGQARRVMDLCWNIGAAQDAGALARAAGV